MLACAQLLWNKRKHKIAISKGGDRLRSIKSITDLDNSDFIIKWRMTEMCNADCSYCIRKSRQRGIDPARLAEQNKRLSEVSGEISRMLDGTRFNSVKIDLIGGEVSILDLEGILSRLSCGKIKRINMTTNLLRDVSYYKGLCSVINSIGAKATAVASFHYEFQDFDRYFAKIEELRDSFAILACEMVSNEGNQELVRRFISKCSELGIDYMAEADLRNTAEDARERGLLTGSSKKVKHDRYKVCYMDGTERNYTARNQLLIDAENEENRWRKAIHTKDFICTNSANFVYIDFDTAVGRTDSSDSCTNRMPIEDFHIIEPRPCPHENCTLCGHMSLWRQ